MRTDQRSAHVAPPAEGGVTMTAAGGPYQGALQSAADGPFQGALQSAADAPGSGAGARSTVEIPPSLYGRFEAFELIGRGGMGAVYKARDLRLGRTVAIKLLLGQDPAGGLLREARSQARLRHPHVCEVYEAGLADQVPFIVMRHVDGASLSQARGQMTLEEKVRAVREVALALHEAHRLGIVHRDVKPGNILVERAEDGTFKPYIADFGIARDASQGGATLANGVLGTPAFMAPEQAGARGGSIDRRTDVYGLGSTLYDTLAGRPPFVEPTVLALLRSLVEAEPTPLRSVAPSVPLDLEAVVMKCLEKDPAARYESAKALGDDLQAFLDGDPVAARRPSWGALLRKRARRHKGKVAAGLSAVIVGLSFAGVRVRDMRIADERAALSRELGGDVREMELFLRSAHAMPLHDIERERAVVRARLRDIEARTSAAGESAAGPGHDALGRGHLALQDPGTALEHLRKASEAGYSAPGLDYAMGLARIELYRQALETASRIQKASDREAYIVRMQNEHRAPALSHLRRALAQGVQSPAYAHGLIALHEGRLEEALSRAQEAFAAAPWLYEAKKLEGDVLLAMGGLTGHDKAFDHARASALFERAAEAYRLAGDLARSDPQVHESECHLWIQSMNAAAEHGDSMRPGFERARGACERAIAASPKRASSHLKLAWAHNCFAFWVATGMRPDESPERALDDAAERVEAAARLSPGDAFASYLVGAVWRSRALYMVSLGLDEAPAVDRAIAGYEAALAVDPGHLWALNEGCESLAIRGRREARRGVDPTATFEQALSRCDRALAIDPELLFPRSNKLFVHRSDAERLLAAGLSPAKAIEQGLSVALATEKEHPAWKWATYWRARLYRLQVEYILSKGEDPGAALAQAEATLPQLAALRGSFAYVAAAEGEIFTVKAEARLARLSSGGAPPAPDPELESALASARADFTAALAGTPWEIGYATGLGRALLDDLRYQLMLGRATEAHADAVLAPLAPFLDRPRESPQLYEIAARAREARAERLREAGQDDGAELEAAVELAERAAAVGPGRATARTLLDGLRRRRPGRKSL